MINETCCRCRCLTDGILQYLCPASSGPTWHPFRQMNSSLTKYWVAGTGNLILPAEVRRHTHTPDQLLTSRCITIHPPGIASASFIEHMAGPKPSCCKECGLGFSQKCHLTRHMHIHAKETFFVMCVPNNLAGETSWIATSFISTRLLWTRDRVIHVLNAEKYSVENSI